MREIKVAKAGPGIVCTTTGCAVLGMLPGRRQGWVTRHLEDDLVDQYVLDQLGNEAAIAAVEEHILHCAVCQSAVDATIRLRDALRIDHTRKVSLGEVKTP